MPETTLLGSNFLAGQPSSLGSERFRAQNRFTGEPLEPEFAVATASEVSQAVSLAAEAAESYASLTANQRADFLDEIATQLEALGDAWLERASQETALAIPRLTGERARTCGQLRMFATLLRDGKWLDVRIELADPDRKPLPKPDLRRTLVPIGPVAVFGASNFPFAFSVAGGDTASALAAGCPVVVKGHPSHPGASEMAAHAINAAAQIHGIHPGVFSLVNGTAEVGKQLVLEPKIAAVGFTGSQAAGRALFDLAASRPRPIPVYAEMGSVNPIFILSGALAERGEALAQGYADSVALGVGQFCTNPGIVVGLSSPEFDQFVEATGNRFVSGAAGIMLNEGIQNHYEQVLAERRAICTNRFVTVQETGKASPALFAVDAQTFLAEPKLQEELFGPTAVAVSCADLAELLKVAELLEGQLTATIHFADSDLETVETILPTVVKLAGRIIANGYPTGVEVNSAMQHGGPYPASTDSRSTSVGTAAIHRFVRPVAFQNFPKALLPTALRL
jgi:2,5-dioxopentanoate dehydrogenase